MKEYDIGIIGSGPGGYVAAIKASQKGKKVVIFEEKQLGGICLNWGCVPTKALLKSAEIYEYAKKSSTYGIISKEVKPDINKIVERSRGIVKQLGLGVQTLLNKKNITVINQHATIKTKNIIKTSEKEYKIKNIIIASGARARILKGFEPDGQFIWSYMHALTPKTIPKKMVIIGSGAIGIEFASFYNSMGTEVTIIEKASHILPHEDKEISNLTKDILEKKNIRINTNANILKTKKENNDIELSYEIDNKEKTIKSNVILMAVGIVGNIENIGLENTKIKTEKNQIIVNNYLQTEEKNIYAIGDVVHGPWLAHKASHEGILAVKHICNEASENILSSNIPACTYSDPQIASIGMTEEQAINKKIEIKIGRFPLYASGKTIINGKTYGMIKIIYSKETGEIIGAHMVGENVTELISNFAIAKNGELTDVDITNSVFPHPTLSETLHEASLDARNIAIHK